jgi:cell division protease FtsH
MSEKQTDDDYAISPASMGPLELAVYRRDFKASLAYQRHVAAVTARRELEAAAKAAQEQVMKVAGARGGPTAAKASRGSLDRLRNSPRFSDDDDDDVERTVEAPTPGRAAARLLLARLFDVNNVLTSGFCERSPVVLVEVADRFMLGRVAHQWQEALGLEGMIFTDIEKLSDADKREEQDALQIVVQEPVAVKERSAADTRAFHAVQLALPIIAICPQPSGYLSKVLIDAATHRLTFPQIDGSLIARVISVATGRRCRTILPDDIVREIGVHELLLGVRFDRTPDDCLAALKKLAGSKMAKKDSRDLTLDQLHGLDEAIGWAKSMIRDLDSWRRGEIAWDAIDAGVIFDGPPGTGKTTLARVIAAESGLSLVSATLAQWQGSGEGHLGHLLRAMRKDFDDARAKAPCIFFIDEIDSFPARGSITHSYKDYVTEVVNAFIEQLDGIGGRQGLIFIGATNDVSRCDPAIIRSGRLNRIIRIGLPDPQAIEKMLRVRLRGELAADGLDEIALLALGSTGADIERIVKDARRIARHAERNLVLTDLRAAITGDDDVPDDLLARMAFHEAGHTLLAVLETGSDGIYAVLGGTADSAGFMASLNTKRDAGTAEDCRRLLRRVLAGRAAEEIVYGAGGNGVGGVAERSDLAVATRVAAAMCGSFGHSGPHPLVFLADYRDTAEIISSLYMREYVQKELDAALRQAKALLSKHRAALDKAAQLLLLKRRITGTEVAAMIDSFERTPEACDARN